MTVEFLRQTLELWRVKADVVPGEGEIAAIVVTDGGVTLTIEHTDDGPFRWRLRSSQTARARPCASLLGVLSAMRVALNVDRGTPVMIAPSAPTTA